MKTFDLGPIRPTNEGKSLLIRAMQGCAWNKCAFCNNYRDCAFILRPLSVLKEEIDTIAEYRDLIYSYRQSGKLDIDRRNHDYSLLKTDEEKTCFNLVYRWISYGDYTIFLQDADALLMRTPNMIELLQYIRKVLPEATRITSYGRPDTLARKTPEEYAALLEAGLGRIHSGFETGSDIVLKKINKGVTSAQQIEGGRKVIESGIELSVFLMAGVGGKALSDENADGTARVINEVNPHFVRLRTAVVLEGAPLWEQLKAGTFDECTDMEQLMEMRRFLTGLHGCTGRLYSDHMINLLQELEGPLEQTDKLIAIIDSFLALPREEQRRYQLAKRMGFSGTWQQMHYLSEKDMGEIDRVCAQVPDGPDWEVLLKSLLRNYI